MTEITLAYLISLQVGGTNAEIDKVKDELIENYFDIHKTKYGVRPRGTLARSIAQGWTLIDWYEKLQVLTEEV
jgi:hypothetical protein